AIALDRRSVRRRALEKRDVLASEAEHFEGELYVRERSDAGGHDHGLACGGDAFEQRYVGDLERRDLVDGVAEGLEEVDARVVERSGEAGEATRSSEFEELLVPLVGQRTLRVDLVGAHTRPQARGAGTEVRPVEVEGE